MRFNYSLPVIFARFDPLDLAFLKHKLELKGDVFENIENIQKL